LKKCLHTGILHLSLEIAWTEKTDSGKFLSLLRCGGGPCREQSDQWNKAKKLFHPSPLLTE